METILCLKRISVEFRTELENVMIVIRSSINMTNGLMTVMTSMYKKTYKWWIGLGPIASITQLSHLELSGILQQRNSMEFQPADGLWQLKLFN